MHTHTMRCDAGKTRQIVVCLCDAQKTYKIICAAYTHVPIHRAVFENSKEPCNYKIATQRKDENFSSRRRENAAGAQQQQQHWHEKMKMKWTKCSYYSLVNICNICVSGLPDGNDHINKNENRKKVHFQSVKVTDNIQCHTHGNSRRRMGRDRIAKIRLRQF